MVTPVWETQGATGTDIQNFGLPTTFAPLFPAASITPSTSCSLQSDATTTIGGIALDRGTEFTLRSFASGVLELELRGQASVDIALRGDPSRRTLIRCGALERALPISEGTSFLVAPLSIDSPLVIRLRGLVPDSSQTTFGFADPIQANAISFTVDRYMRDGQAPYRSGIRSGSVRVKGTDGERKLRLAEPLRLEEVVGWVTSLQVVKNNISITFEGTASTIRAGMTGFEEDLKPSLLSYLKSLHLLEITTGTSGLVLFSIALLSLFRKATPNEHSNAKLPDAPGPPPHTGGVRE